MAVSEIKKNKYNSAFSAIRDNDLRSLMNIVPVMISLKYGEKCPVEDSPFYGSGLIHAAAEYGSPEVIHFLLNQGYNINLKGYMGKTPLHWVIADRKKYVPETIGLLLQAKADVNARDADGDTPLHYAVCRDIQIAEILVKNRAKVNLKNIWGETPLHLAAERGNTDMINYLLDHGANINACDNNGCTPLRHALFGRDPENAAACLLDRGADPTDPDNEGNTTLHCAAQSGENQVVMLLVKAGADRSFRNKQGHIAGDLAVTPEIAAKLCRMRKRTKKIPTAGQTENGIQEKPGKDRTHQEDCGYTATGTRG